MGQPQSKDELLYQQVKDGNIEGIKALRHQGAGLEVSLCVSSIVGFFNIFGIMYGWI